MCGMPCEVQRMVACRPPGVPTVPARATSGVAAVLPASREGRKRGQERDT